MVCMRLRRNRKLTDSDQVSEVVNYRVVFLVELNTNLVLMAFGKQSTVVNAQITGSN